MWGMFSGEFNQDISSWDVSNVTNMSGMFSDAKNFNQDISSWDVSNVTDMRSMFYDVVKFNQDISSWDVSNVTDMSGMFSGAEKFNQDISSWDVSNVTNMGDMFELANNFNQDISSWDVSNVTNMSGMFFKAISFNQNLKKWKVNSVLDYSWFSKNADSWKLIKPKFEMNATNLRTKTIDELTPYKDIDFLNKSDSQVSNFSKRGYYRFTYLTLDLHNPTYIWIDNLTIPKNICEEELGSAFAESIGLEVLADDDNDEGIPVGESCVYVETLMYKYDKGIEQIGWIEEEIMKYDIEKWWEIDIIFIPIEFIKTYINDKKNKN
jgi:surface protein